MIVTHTYDGRPVHAEDSDLPEGAVCWTFVEIPMRGAYTTWSEDPKRGGPALTAMEADVERLHSHAALDAAIAEAGGCPDFGSVKSKRTYLACLRAARMFPLRIAGGARFVVEAPRG